MKKEGRKRKMEYYAKSKRRDLSIREKERLKEFLQNILLNEQLELNEKEKIYIEKAMDKLYEINDMQNNMKNDVQDDDEQKKKGEKQKTLKEHEEDIVRCAQQFFEDYGVYFTEKEQKLVIEACRLHDLGKTNQIFQAIVNPKLKEKMTPRERKEKQIPHGFLSALSINKKEFAKLSELFNREDFNAFITAIYYHHSRKDEWENTQIEDYCEKYYLDYAREYSNNEELKLYCSNRRSLLFRNNNIDKTYTVNNEKWNQYLLIKGLLNKFDYIVSAGYEKAEENCDLKNKKLQRNIKESLKKYELRPAQKYMMKNQDKNLIIVAPTGSGKTEAALLWLNGEKGFYTLPLKVSSNAIYNRIKEMYDYDEAAILHSDSMQIYLEEEVSVGDEAYIKYEKAKMLSSPVTVCTVDQLFKFVYKALGTEIFAATLKYSKLILDEVQAYSPRVIATIIYALKKVKEMGGHFAIITATFPPVLKDFMEEYELIEGKDYLFQDFSKESDSLRHKVEIREGEMDILEIVEQGEEKKVLVICNTVFKAQSIYCELREQMEEVYLLHSRYIRRDRIQLENKIMEFSNDSKKTGIWITTQIVEASLDIDFDILYTEMCTSDSLLQRMGRCNRKGRYLPDTANIIVYDNKNGVGKNAVYEPALYERSLEKLYLYENKLFSEQMKTQYINEVYCTDEIKELKDSCYYTEIKKYLEHFDSIHPLEYSKEETDNEFRNIKSITVIPDSIYNKNQYLFEEGMEILKTPHIDKNVKNIFSVKLSSLTLSLNCYGKMPRGVDICVIDKRRKEGNIHRTSLLYEFDEKTGKGRGLLLGQIEQEQFFI